MATLEYCFAASDDVEETPASSRLPANMLMFTASSVASDCKIRQITHRAFPLSLGMLGGIENLDNTTPDRRSSLGDGLDADQLRPAAEISPASMRHLQTRGEVVPRGDNPSFANEVSDGQEATGNSDYFWQGSVILQCGGARRDSALCAIAQTQLANMRRKWP